MELPAYLSLPFMSKTRTRHFCFWSGSFRTCVRVDWSYLEGWIIASGQLPVNSTWMIEDLHRHWGPVVFTTRPLSEPTFVDLFLYSILSCFLTCGQVRKRRHHRFAFFQSFGKEAESGRILVNFILFIYIKVSYFILPSLSRVEYFNLSVEDSEKKKDLKDSGQWLEGKTHCC